MDDHKKSRQLLVEELAELRRSETKWRSVVENTPVFVALVDRRGTLQYLNRTVPGIAMEDAVGRSTFEFVKPEYWEVTRESIERVFDTGQPAFYEAVSAGPHGGSALYATYVGPVRIGEEIVAVTLAAIDITARKRAEEELRETEERFKLFMDHSPAIAWMKDEQGRYVYSNRSCGARLGMEPKDRLGKTDFELWPEATAGQFWENDQKVLTGGQVLEVVEESTLPDGTPSYCHNYKFPFQDSTGKRFVGGVGIDITDQRRAKEALQKAHDELELRVEERTAELAKAYEALARQHHTLKHLLQSSDRERQLIAYEIHDGLAQQLAGAIMQFQVFDHLRDKKPKAAAKAYDAALTMLQQGHSEARRLIAGVRPPILDESGVVEAIAHLVNELRRQKGPQIEFLNIVQFDRLVPVLENAIYRICQEALTNACQHSGSQRVRVTLLQQKDSLRIEVRDWGVGFDAKSMPKDHYGLEGIRQRVKLLGGKCGIRSKSGKGTQVVVKLAVVEREDGAGQGR